AAQKYQRALEVLLKLCALYPTAAQNRVYMEHAEAYRRRIQELQTQAAEPDHPLEGRDPSKPTSFDQWVLTEKPDISWDDIAGLERPKRAIEESIIFPVCRPDLFPLAWPRRILFFGPPGFGKILLAVSIVTEVKVASFCVSVVSLL